MYITSDQHFFHKNIIKYANRPFDNVKEMNDYMIKMWNDTIKKDDKVFFLGDFSFGTKEQTKSLISQLNGYKVMIMGNHDRSKSFKWWYEAGFDEVSKHPIILNDYFILSHEPVFVNDYMPYMNFHGHKHHLEIKSDKYYNVCVEKHGYKPINLDKLINKLKDD